MKIPKLVHGHSRRIHHGLPSLESILRRVKITSTILGWILVNSFMDHDKI
jgi:hypothetical protein